MATPHEIPDGQSPSPTGAAAEDHDRSNELSPTSSAGQGSNKITSNHLVINIAAPKSTNPLSGHQSDAVAQTQSRPHPTGHRLPNSQHPTRPRSRSPGGIMSKDRRIRGYTAQNTSTNSVEFHRAQVVMVTNSASFTRQELCTKLDELRDLFFEPAPPAATESALLATSTISPDILSNSKHGLAPVQTRTLTEAQRILNKHVTTLSRYNEIKNVAMEMLGILAEQKGMTMKEIMAERGMDEAD